MAKEKTDSQSTKATAKQSTRLTTKSKSQSKGELTISKINSMDIETLKNQSLDLHKEQFNLVMQLKTNQLKNTSELRKVRRNIARVKTILHEKTSEQQKNNLKEAN